jgi:hypothetical protein
MQYMCVCGATGVKLPPPDYDHLNAALRKQCVRRNLQATEYFMLKVRVCCAHTPVYSVHGRHVK